MRGKYAYLLGDDDVRRWFDNLAAKSYLTATVYLRNLGFYCELNGADPKALLKVAKTFIIDQPETEEQWIIWPFFWCYQ